MIKNKKADLGDMTMVFAFLFLLIISDLGILAGIWIFYGSGYDAREAEASLLNYKIKDCILNNEISDDITEEIFFELCSLNKKAIEANNIIKLCKNEPQCVDSDTPLFFSGSNFQSCLFEGAKKNENFPQCKTTSFQKNSDTYQIIVGSKQLSRTKQA